MAQLSDGLLREGEDQGKGQGSWLVRATAGGTVVVAISSLCMVFFAGAAFGRSTPHQSRAVSLSLAGLHRNASLREKPVTFFEGFESSCYAFTGITCEQAACGAERNAVCKGEKCMCSGGCAGVDKTCHESNYEVVATGFTIYNAKYNWQHMYMPPISVLDSIKTSLSPPLLQTDKWNLYKVPGGKPQAYFLGSAGFSGWVANIQPTTLTAFSLFGAYGADLVKEGSPEWYAVRVCSLGDGKVKIGSYKEPVEWFYIHHGSWIVYGWGLTNDPGEGGHWVPTPTIPETELEQCP